MANRQDKPEVFCKIPNIEYLITHKSFKLDRGYWGEVLCTKDKRGYWRMVKRVDTKLRSKSLGTSKKLATSYTEQQLDGLVHELCNTRKYHQARKERDVKYWKTEAGRWKTQYEKAQQEIWSLKNQLQSCQQQLLTEKS